MCMCYSSVYYKFSTMAPHYSIENRFYNEFITINFQNNFDFQLQHQIIIILQWFNNIISMLTIQIFCYILLYITINNSNNLKDKIQFNYIIQDNSIHKEFNLWIN